jgi:putative membrane-bound dehydrogenase-like protein
MKKTSIPVLASLLGAAAALAANPAGAGPEAARASLKSFTVADGLEVSLFASEPMVRNPANMDIDAKGRVWVTEGANYRLFQKWGKLRPEGDRIVVLEDTNQDGVADKETTFYQGNEINTALGICVLANKVIVSCSPNVFLFSDTNRDLKADGPPLTLFKGIKGVDHDHGVHAFVFGPDGKLYFNMGNEGKELHRPDGSLVKDREGIDVVTSGRPYRQGLAFRCNMAGGDFEVVGQNFRNNYEIAVDSFGTLWQSDNDDDGNRGVRINNVMEFGNFGYTDEMTGAGWGSKRTNLEEDVPRRHWHQNDPGVVPNLLLTGAGSPTGITVYEGTLLPEEYRGQILHCDAGPRVVRAYLTHPDGAGYKAEIKDILTTSDNWFRPSDLCVAPDGSLYVADWNDAGVGGHYMADQKLETMTGRIYRVAPRGHKPSVPAVNLRDPDGQIAALRSPNQALRYLGWNWIDRTWETGVPNLLVQMFKNSKEPWLRARALYLLCRHQLAGKQNVYFGLRDSDPNLRITALRAARERQYDLIPYLSALIHDPSPQVRRECAIALRHSSSPEAPKLWAQLALQHDGKDRWYLEALGIGADKQWDKYLDAWLSEAGDGWNSPAGRDIVWRSRSRKTPALLVKIINDRNTSAAERPRYFRSLDFITGPEKDAALLELVTTANPPR